MEVSVDGVPDSRTGDRWFERQARPNFFLRIDGSHCDGIHSSFTAVHFFNDGHVGKQPAAWKEYCAEYWLKELQKSMDRCTGRRDITEILLNTTLNTIQSINSMEPALNLYRPARVAQW